MDDIFSKLYHEAVSPEKQSLEDLAPSYDLLDHIDERYTDFSLIGAGATKDVFKSFDNKVQKYIALAKPKEHLSVRYFESLIHEAWLTAHLEHPNIINIHDICIDKNRLPYFTMDLKSGGDLRDYVGTHKDLSTLIECFSKVCNAVSYAHSQGVIHLDIKPENIQCGDYGEVLVCDWGLGRKVADDLDGGFDAITFAYTPSLDGEIQGTPGYMSPEQCVDGGIIDHRSDIYSLGALFHFMLTGKPPHTGGSQTLIRMTRGGAPRIRESFSHLNVPKGVAAIVDKALKTAPEERYQSVEGVLSDLSLYAKGFPTSAEKANLFRRGILFLMRHKSALLILLPLLGVLLSVGGYTFKSMMEARLLRSQVTDLNSHIDQINYDYSTYNEFRNLNREEIATVLRNESLAFLYVPFDRQVGERLKRLRALSVMYLNDYPNCFLGRSIRYRLNAIELNCYSMEDCHILQTDKYFPGYRKLAETFSAFDFSRERRPSVEQIVMVLQESQKSNPEQKELMSYIVHYDWHCRRDKEGYEAVVVAFLNYINNEDGSFSASFDPQTRKMIIEAEGTFSVLVKEAYNNILGIPVHETVQLNVTGLCDLQTLHHSHCETLDLSQAPFCSLEKRIVIPQLKKIIFHPNQSNVDNIKELIKSDYAVELVK